MKDLIEFLSGYEPKYPGIVRGYSLEEIERLEEVLGRALPPAQRDFFSTAAANLGFSHEDLTFDLDEVMQVVTEKRDTMPPTFSPLAMDLSPTQADYFLDLGRPAAGRPLGEDGAVVCSAAGNSDFEDLWYVYPSLRDMLFSWGFDRVRMLTLSHRCSVHWQQPDFADPSTAPTMEMLGQILENLGLRPLHVTGPTMPLYDRGDCAVSVTRSMNGPTFSMHLAATDETEALRIAEIACDQMAGQGKLRLR